MPLAVTHVLIAIILVDLYRDYVTHHKKYFSLHTILIAGIGGLLPDIDIPLHWFFSLFGFDIIHGTFTHTPIFALVFLIPGLILWFEKKRVWAVYGFVIAFGILLHVFLDVVIGGGHATGSQLLYPFSEQTFKLHLLLGTGLIEALDAIILILWLWHEEHKHKILDFI